MCICVYVYIHIYIYIYIYIYSWLLALGQLHAAVVVHEALEVEHVPGQYLTIHKQTYSRSLSNWLII